MYPRHSEGKSAVGERFIRTLNIKSKNIWLKFQRM